MPNQARVPEGGGGGARPLTAPESKHLTTKNIISEFLGSGIDSGISEIAGDPPRGLLVGTKLVSQNLAGFWKFSTFCWFLDEEAFILPIQMLPKKVVIFTVSKLAFLCGFPARRRYQIRKLEGFSFSLHVGTSPNSKQRKSYSCSKLANRMKNGPENGAFQNLKNLTKSYKTLQISPLYIFRVDDT